MRKITEPKKAKTAKSAQIKSPQEIVHSAQAKYVAEDLSFADRTMVALIEDPKRKKKKRKQKIGIGVAYEYARVLSGTFAMHGEHEQNNICRDEGNIVPIRSNMKTMKKDFFCSIFVIIYFKKMKQWNGVVDPWAFFNSWNNTLDTVGNIVTDYNMNYLYFYVMYLTTIAGAW